MACREGDTEPTILNSSSPGQELSLRALRAGAQMHGPGAQAGRSLLGWAIEAGFAPEKIEYSNYTITYVV